MDLDVKAKATMLGACFLIVSSAMNSSLFLFIVLCALSFRISCFSKTMTSTVIFLEL